MPLVITTMQFQDNNFLEKNGKLANFGKLPKILKNNKKIKVWCSYIL